MYQDVGSQRDHLWRWLEVAPQDAEEGEAGGCIHPEFQRLEHQALHPHQVFHLHVTLRILRRKPSVSSGSLNAAAVNLTSREATRASVGI